MLFVNVLIMLFIAVLVLFALRKRIKASKDNQPVYDDNGILIGYVDKNMMFHGVSKTIKQSNHSYNIDVDKMVNNSSIKFLNKNDTNNMLINSNLFFDISNYVNFYI